MYFPLNDTRINDQEKEYLDSLVEIHLLSPDHKMRLLGYTDNLGKSSHNDSLSKERAKSVQQYFITSGFNDTDITLCMGEGELDRTATKIKGGYAADRKVLVIADKARNAPRSLIDIKTVQVNEPISLKNIFFAEGTPGISPISYPELIQLYQFLSENKTVTIQIEGHICCLPPEQGTDVPLDNSTLSTLRAKAVTDYLVKKGIDKKRIKYIGLGNTKPAVTPEVTDDDMERNRRVEVRIMSK